MLKLYCKQKNSPVIKQPPSGGCVLKHLIVEIHRTAYWQPPSGGCVLKQSTNQLVEFGTEQPPSGGCVLKPITVKIHTIIPVAATFGWLCVETMFFLSMGCQNQAATFGWLCVETRF